MLMIQTIAQALDNAAASSGAFVFVRENGRELATPYKVLRDSALALGGALRARGLHRGDHVALLIPEADGFLTAFLGVSLAGLVPIPLAHPLDIGRLGADIDKVAASSASPAGVRSLPAQACSRRFARCAGSRRPWSLSPRGAN